MNDYYRDKRTQQEYEHNYKQGIKGQDVIVERLKQYFGVEEKIDTYGVHKAYEEDATIWYGDFEAKIEIKYTKSTMSWMEWKMNQYQYAEKNNVYLLCVAGGKVGWASIKSPKIFIDKDHSYCNKDVYRVKPIWFDNFQELFEHLIK